MAKRFTASDMVTGLIRVLVDRGYSSLLVRTNRLDEAFEKAFRRLMELAPEHDLDVRFRIARDDFGESQVLRMALSSASQRDLVSFDNPEYKDMRTDRKKVVSTVYFESLPATRELYEDLADVLLGSYEQSVPVKVPTSPAPA